MSERPECVVFNSHTSTDYVLEGAELSASSDSWAGNWVCGLTPLENTTGSRAHLCSPPPPSSCRGIVACRLLRFTGGIGGPLLPLDELSLMAAALKADGPIWGKSVFYFSPACLGWAFIRLPGFAVLPTWWYAKGLKRLSFVSLSNKSWWFTNKK